MSLVGIFGGKERVVIASESRVIGTDGKPYGSQHKIFQAGDFCCLGFVGLVGLLGSESLARRIEAACSEPELRDNPRALVEALSQDIHPRLTALVAANPDHFRRWLRDGIGRLLTVLAVKRSAVTGSIELSAVVFPLTDVSGRPTAGKPYIQIDEVEPLFRAWIAHHGDELNARTLDADLADHELVAAAEGLFAAIQTNNIGPLSHLAVIDSSGFRWLLNT